MMKNKYLPVLAILSLCLFFFLSCKKETEPDPETQTPLEFISLTSGVDTLSFGETTKLKAVATGEELSYVWIADQGDIIGSGDEVNYAPSACTIGDVLISCEVSDNTDSETKEIRLYVQ